ncbi:hypothetical protein [Trinickia sp. Y13]|uniref:hypothetical protein n=1 Tax=Trinickia sp. Y13 TaxID=2917807 RepID=UPI0024063AEB|nr:hypothetical protein [Trinickia sp. Y13]MDG0024956.1 hypothetical protein [Trinickia sp. Y13]
MTISLKTVLPQLVEPAIMWAEEQERNALVVGSPLGPYEIADARAVGVRMPEKIRVVTAPSLPMPTDPWLRTVAQDTGLLGSHVLGLTLGYAIFLVEGRGSRRLLTHECRHVHQYERSGSIKAFLPEYLRQIATIGYEAAPLELDALAHEIG